MIIEALSSSSKASFLQSLVAVIISSIIDLGNVGGEGGVEVVVVQVVDGLALCEVQLLTANIPISYGSHHTSKCRNRSAEGRGVAGTSTLKRW